MSIARRSVWHSVKYGKARKVEVNYQTKDGKFVRGWINGKIDHKWETEEFLELYRRVAG